MTYEDFMRVAISEAQEALADDELPVGCVVVFRGEIIGKAHRTKAGNTRLDHAETVALRMALDGRLRKTPEMTLYTTLEPCIMCFGAILNCWLGNVVYGIEDPFGGATLLLKATMPIRHQLRELPSVEGGILQYDIRKLFQQYFATTENDYWSSHSDNPLVVACQSLQ